MPMSIMCKSKALFKGITMNAEERLKSKYINHEQLTLILGISDRTLADLRRAGEFKYVAITDKNFIYRVSDIEAWLDSKVTQKPAGTLKDEPNKELNLDKTEQKSNEK